MGWLPPQAAAAVPPVDWPPPQAAAAVLPVGWAQGGTVGGGCGGFGGLAHAGGCCGPVTT